MASAAELQAQACEQGQGSQRPAVAQDDYGSPSAGTLDPLIQALGRAVDRSALIESGDATPIRPV